MPVAGVAEIVPSSANDSTPRGILGAHQQTVMRVLYVAMAIALAALLYTAYVAYQRYAAVTPPALVHDPPVSVKPVPPDPEVKTPTPPKDHDGELVKPEKPDKSDNPAPEKSDDDTKAASRPKKP